MRMGERSFRRAARQPIAEKCQRIELAKGYAEITFDCGAQVVLGRARFHST